MAKNNEKSVTTNSTAVDNMTEQERLALFQSLAASFASSDVVINVARDLSSAAKAKTEAELATLNAREAEIRSEIAARNEELKTLLTRKRELGAPVRGEGTRTVNVCAECGQGRHADNEKTRACATYAKAQQEKAAALQQKAA